MILSSSRSLLATALLFTVALAGCTRPASVAAPVTSSGAQSTVHAPLGAARIGGPLSPADSAWVEATLASLTLREKVGQLIMPWVGGEFTPIGSAGDQQLRRWVEEDRVGGLILSIGLPHSYVAKLNRVQGLARVPLIVAADMENGPGMRMANIYALPSMLPQGGGTLFPPVMALGATGSDSLARELGRVLGREARAVGVHLTFGPVLDVNSNPDNPIINTRSFGEDPDLVGRLARAYIAGAHEHGLMTTGKHFPGHGNTDVDSHIDLPTIPADRARLDSVELRPFRTVVDAGIDAIMTAHIAVTGVEGPGAPPATLSSYFMTQVLRDEMGFRGLLFTDAMDMGGVVRRYGRIDPLVMALEAGADVLLMPLSATDAINTVVAAVGSGRLTEERIDRSVRRILAAKARAGLRHGRMVSVHAVDSTVGIPAHEAVAEEIARRSITLARDQRSLVPITGQRRRILSLTYGTRADLIAGRIFDRELARAGHRVTSIRLDDRTTAAEYESIRLSADTMDLVMASAYVQPVAHAGSVATDGPYQRLIEGLATAGRPVIAVSFGSPYLLSSHPSVPAYLLAWGSAPVSQRAAARALLGESAITGRLPISLPPHHALGEGITRPARTAGAAP